MKDGRTYLAYMPERAVDLDTGAIVSADNHGSDGGHCGQRLPFSGSSERTGWWSLEDKDR